VTEIVDNVLDGVLAATSTALVPPFVCVCGRAMIPGEVPAASVDDE
jgi:hypothetical protein